MADRLKYWSCRTCSRNFDTYLDALECCPPEEGWFWVCGVCAEMYVTETEARKCETGDVR